MLNVLIVDDEPFIRQGLSMLIDWEAEGFCITGEASDGKEALRMLEEQPYDLVIADIRMPAMTGLELIEEIRARGIRLDHFVVLSGYNDFEYARRAMRSGCTDYLLKPVTKEALLATLRKIVDESEAIRANEAKDEAMAHAVFERNLIPVIVGKYDDLNLSYVEERLYLSNCIRYINVELDMTDERFRELDEEKRRRAQRMLYRSILECLGEDEMHAVFDVNKHENCYDAGMIYCDRFASERRMSEKEYFGWIKSCAEASVDCGVVMQIGCEVSELRNLSESYRSANIAKYMQEYDGGLYIAEPEEGGEQPVPGAAESAAEKNGDIKEKLDAVVDAIAANNAQLISENVKKLYRGIGESQLDYRMIRVNLNYLMFRLLRLAVERDPNLDQQEVMRYIIDNAFERGAMRGSWMHFATFCTEYADYLKQISTSTSGSALAGIEREIAEHYMWNISLKQLSEKFFINSAYLGQMFKKQYGISFKDYLNNVRLARAAELLLTTDMRVYEVSEAVGYQSVDYFISKFVAMYKHTPTQYRKKMLRSGKSDAPAE